MRSYCWAQNRLRPVAKSGAALMRAIVSSWLRPAPGAAQLLPTPALLLAWALSVAGRVALPAMRSFLGVPARRLLAAGALLMCAACAASGGSSGLGGRSAATWRCYEALHEGVSVQVSPAYMRSHSNRRTTIACRYMLSTHEVWQGIVSRCADCSLWSERTAMSNKQAAPTSCPPSSHQTYQ